MKNVYEIDGVLIRDSKEGFAARKARTDAARAKSDAAKHMQAQALREVAIHASSGCVFADLGLPSPRRNNDHEDDGA